MELNAVVANDLFSMDFGNDYANITIGEHHNRFQCCTENVEALLHMMDVLTKSSGLYGTDIVDVECVLERCTNHQFRVMSHIKMDLLDVPIVVSETKGAIFLIIGCAEMGFWDVNCIIKEIVRHYPIDSEIIFTAENSEIIPKGHYTLCILE